METASSKQLRFFKTSIIANVLKERVVIHLRYNLGNIGFPLELFVERPWDFYANDMSHGTWYSGTYGDQIMQQTISDTLNVQFQSHQV